jgi:hypothetical protein
MTDFRAALERLVEEGQIYYDSLSSPNFATPLILRPRLLAALTAARDLLSANPAPRLTLDETVTQGARTTFDVESVGEGVIINDWPKKEGETCG